MEPTRERLRDLSARLLRLHTVLLDRERRAYEHRLGSPPSPPELFRLLLHDPHFAWLRSLSRLIAEIDERVDGGDPVAADAADGAHRAAYRLLKSGQGGEFQDRYCAALQDSPDVVLVHAHVSGLLRGGPWDNDACPRPSPTSSTAPPGRTTEPPR